MHQVEAENICLRLRAYFDYACMSRVRLELHHCMGDAAELRFIDSRDTTRRLSAIKSLSVLSVRFCIVRR